MKRESKVSRDELLEMIFNLRKTLAEAQRRLHDRYHMHFQTEIHKTLDASDIILDREQENRKFIHEGCTLHLYPKNSSDEITMEVQKVVHDDHDPRTITVMLKDDNRVYTLWGNLEDGFCLTEDGNWDRAYELKSVAQKLITIDDFEQVRKQCPTTITKS